MEISIVVPVYNEEETINSFYEKVSNICQTNNISYEIIFVDDGSKDGTIKKIKELRNSNSNIHYISFSRNFGKDAAILAGMIKSKGTFCAVMDVDLQDPPELLPEMYNRIKNSDLDCIETRRQTRQGEPILRSLFAKAFCMIMNISADVHITDGIRDFRLMRRNVVDAVISIEESNRFSKGLFSWVGFKTECITYPNIERVSGKTKWSFWSLLKYAVNGLISFSTLPLYLPFIFGVIISILALVGLFINLTLPINLFQTTILLLFGINIIFIGILGIYIAKIHTESQKRPLYIIREEI